MPQIKFALSRGFASSGLYFVGFTQGGARGLACPGLLSAALTGLSVSGFADISNCSPTTQKRPQQWQRFMLKMHNLEIVGAC
jgi:hypothetical protein